MHFRHIDAFRAVMRTRSMTVAANLLHTSQPNISRVISQLQAETGLTLFKRVGLRLEPTPEAVALLREVERAFIGLQTIEEAASTIKTRGAGGLRIAVSPALAVGLMPQAILEFRKAHPHVPVTVYTSDSASVCKWTESSYCDFGLVSYIPDVANVYSHVVHKQHGVCILSTSHRLASKKRVRATDLSGESFISMAKLDFTRQKIDAAFNPDERRLELETPHAATICMMVARGLGVSIVNPLVYQALGLPGLKALPFEPRIDFTCYSVHTNQGLEQALVSEFLVAVKKSLRPS